MMDLRAKLRTVISDEIWAVMTVVKETAVSLNMPIYLIGGLVRDLLLNKPPTDLDFIFEGDASLVAKQMKLKFGGTLVIHPAFGTAVWTIDKSVWQGITFSDNPPPFQSIDFVTTRTESYTEPAALPTVTQSNLQDDLKRRDFTINAMGIRLDGPTWGDLIDPLGGQQDLEEGKIRLLHDQSFEDDPTRMLRVARYASRLNFEMTVHTATLLKNALPVIQQTSGIRLWHELDLALQEPNPVKSLRHMQTLGILAQIVPELRVGEHTAVFFKKAQSRSSSTFVFFAIWMLMQPETVETAVLDRLAIPARMQGKIRQLRQRLEMLQSLPESAKPSEIVPNLSGLSDEEMIVLGCLLDTPPAQQWLVQYKTKWRTIKPTINGGILIAKGLKPGPHFKVILQSLQVAWLDGKITDTQSELVFLEKLIESLNVS